MQVPCRWLKSLISSRLEFGGSLYKKAGYPSGALGAFPPYFDPARFSCLPPPASSAPRTMWYRTPGRSLTRPPRTSTTECSCRLWPSPGMKAVISVPFVSLTLATLRRAELGLRGVIVYTRVHTPRFCGELSSAPDFDFFLVRVFRPFLTS